jgi:putative transposase
MKINRVLIIPYKPKAIHYEVRQETGRLWTDCVKLHKYIRKRSYKNPDKWKWSNSIDFQKHFKGRYNLHSQTIQGIIQKFFANIETYFSNKKQGITTARLPRRYKKYFNPIFKKSAIKHQNNRVRLSIGNKEYIYFSIPDIDGEIVLAELGYNKLYLTIQKDIEVPTHNTEKVAGIDFGIIHTAVITDGIKSFAIVGRGIRSIKQGHAKTLAKLYKKISKTKKGSRRNRKLRKALYKLKEKKANRLRNAFHQISRKITNWCIENRITTVVIGDLENINKNKKKKRQRQCNKVLKYLRPIRLKRVVRSSRKVTPSKVA